MLTVVVDVPCPLGPTGRVADVHDSPRVRRMVDRGWVTILRDHSPLAGWSEDEPEPEGDDDDDFDLPSVFSEPYSYSYGDDDDESPG